MPKSKEKNKVGDPILIYKYISVWFLQEGGLTFLILSRQNTLSTVNRYQKRIEMRN